MNIDYAVCNALSYNTQGLKTGLVIYDIACHWIINFFRRLLESNHMSIPDAMSIIAAVGKFHLSAHVDGCFAKHSLNFIRGAGQLDGEILETLWSAFNKIAAFARVMSKAGRREIYDDFMRDSNWKKLVGMSMYSSLVSLPCLSFR